MVEVADVEVVVTDDTIPCVSDGGGGGGGGRSGIRSHGKAEEPDTPRRPGMRPCMT